MLNGAAVSTELFKIKGDVKKGYFDSIFPYCSPVSGGGGGFSTTPT